MATLAAHGYAVQHPDAGFGPALDVWTLTHDDGCGEIPRALFIGDHGCISPTKWEAVAEGLLRIEIDAR